MGSTKYPLVPPPGGGTPNLPGPGQPAPMRPDEFQSGAQPNFVTFGWTNVGPPSAIYLQRDDVLFIAVVSNNSLETFNINYRFLEAPLPQGGQPGAPIPQTAPVQALSSNQIKVGQLVIAPGQVGLVVTRSIVLGEGYLLAVSGNSGQIGRRGRSFVRAWIVRGVAGLNNVYQTLFEDYVTDQQSAGWPGGRQLNVIEGPGWRHSINVANPAAGTDWAFTAGGQQRVSVLSFTAQFTASAAAANRQIQVIIDDGANTVWQTSVLVNVTAGQVAVVSGAQSNAPQGIVALALTVVIPPGIILPPLWRLRTSTTGIQGGDQWSLIWLSVEEWLDAV